MDGEGARFARQLQRSLREQRSAVVGVGLVMIVVTTVVGLAYALGVPPKSLLDDPAKTLGGSPFVGALSVLGVLAWVVAAVAALGALKVTSGGRAADRRLLRTVGVASVVLWVDDQFMLHDGLLRNDLGVSELWITFPYIVAALWIAATTWRSVIDHPEGVLLILAVAFLGASLLIDIGAPAVPGVNAVEDLAKLTGLCFWGLFSVRAAVRLIRREIQDGHDLPTRETVV
jgi:hypothetical protein